MDIEKQHELYKTKKYKAMRDHIVTTIKYFIMLLRERNTIVDTQCAKDRKKKKPIVQPIDDVQEFDNSTNLYIADNVELMEYNYSEIIHSRQDLIKEIDYMFTIKEISISVVNSLIHVSYIIVNPSW